MKNKKFVHCPRQGCDKPLRGAWRDYLNGETHPKTGLPIYQCPNCHAKFTADSFKANAIPVPEGDKDVILYDTSSKKIMDIVPNEMKFTDGKFNYVHLPVNMCIQEHIRCFSFKAKGLTTKEIEAACEDAIRKNVEVYR